MMSRSSAIALFFSALSPTFITSSSSSSSSSSSDRDQQSIPSWRAFGSNVNYRITAILDVNGGADAGPNFDTFTGSDNKRPADDALLGEGWWKWHHHDHDHDHDDATKKEGDDMADDAAAKQSIKTPGYSVPIDVLTTRDSNGKYRQRISYYGGMQVDYNNDGMGYKVINTPYTTGTGHSSASSKEDDNDGAKQKSSKNMCFFIGGDSTVKSKKQGFLNFFPTVKQMDHYTLGSLVTSEPGVPYRIATLEAPHGSYNATSKPSQPDASYDAHPGMPTEDWFQFHYEESLSKGKEGGGNGAAASTAHPLKWTMLARNQIINAHTENWVIRYLSYEAIDGDDEVTLWEGYFDAKFGGACGTGNEDRTTLVAEIEDDNRSLLRMNRLGMFFSESGIESHIPSTSDGANAPSHFDTFLARHNRQYPHLQEYMQRKAVHDGNVRNVKKWNREHAGKTKFVPNEYMDMEVKEFMSFRGGHIPRGAKKAGRGIKLGQSDEAKRGNLRQKPLLGDDGDDDGDEYKFPQHEVPKYFDPSTLPKEFDWRDHLPGSVGPIKDQGFCGSCWAFSFISAMESHWFINHGGQHVDLPEQFVNDCAWSENVHACDGGESAIAAKVIIDNFKGRIPTRDAYGGYLSVDGGCYVDILQDMGMMDDNELMSKPSSSTVQLTDWVLLPERDDIATKHALYTKGPVAIAMNIVEEAIYYSSGVLDVESCSKHGVENLDHAINVVGWGVDTLPDGTEAEHWIVRNSWSDLWGDSGYFKVRMGDRDCGVTTSAGYPLISGTNGHILGQPLGTVATN